MHAIEDYLAEKEQNSDSRYDLGDHEDSSVNYAQHQRPARQESAQTRYFKQVNAQRCLKLGAGPSGQ